MQLSRLRDMTASLFLLQGPNNLNNFDTAWQDRGLNLEVCLERKIQVY